MWSWLAHNQTPSQHPVPCVGFYRQLFKLQFVTFVKDENSS